MPSLHAHEVPLGEDMVEIGSVITVLASGVLAMIVAVVTSKLAQGREAKSFHRERARHKYEETRSVYVEMLGAYESALRLTTNLSDYEELTRQLPILNARMRLVEARAVAEQHEKTSAAIARWSSEYRRGAPKPVGDTGMVMISSTDTPHQERASALFPEACQAVIDLTECMKVHLAQLEI